MLLLGSVAALSYGQNYAESTHRQGCEAKWGTGACQSYWAAIDEVSIQDASGNEIYKKAGDGCTDVCNNYQTPQVGDHHSVIENTSAFTLNAGSTYKLFITPTNPRNSNWGANAGVWIDYNGDKDFADAGEFIDNLNGIAVDAAAELEFTVPCNGTAGDIRLRIRTDADRNLAFNATMHTQQVNYGETEDYTATYATPNGLSSNFLVPDSAFIGTRVTFTNSNQTGYIGHTWTIDGTTYTETNAQHVFNTPGTYDVKLVSENCLGKDSTTKTVRIVSPSAPPVANFIADKNVIELYEEFQLFDLSSNGATYWDWRFIKGNDTVDVDEIFELQGNDLDFNKDPLVQTGDYIGALDVGVWDVELSATNILGQSPYFKKVGYINVVRTNFRIGPETANTITSPQGVIFDQAGEFADYATFTGSGELVVTALIAPCGAESITLEFDTFAVEDNVEFLVFDGTDPTGTPLHPTGGFNDVNIPNGPLTATSGAMHLRWIQQPGGQADLGFAARWTSVQGPEVKPVADFELPEVDIYNAVPFRFENTSQNVDANTTYSWTISGVENFTSQDEDYENLIGITSNGKYTVTLTVENCDGNSSSVTKSFDVLEANSPTEIDFIADNRRPTLGGEVEFTAISDKANRWEWSFFPPTGVSEPNPGTIDSRTRTFAFTNPGAYAVQLRGYNSLDSAASVATVVKTNYILVVENCVPIVSLLSQDVGIGTFYMQDVSMTGPMINNQSSIGQSGYTNYADELGTFNVNYGGEYAFRVSRNTTLNNMTKRIWVDWNVDGDFDDANELVAFDDNPNQDKDWTGVITIPDFENAFDAITTLRIGTSLDNDLNLPCGAATNAAANRVGEFEDYAIRVVNDGDQPVITLNGEDTIYVEQLAPGAAQTYMSAGATAFDPSQGVISPVMMTTDLDQTLAGIYYEDYNITDASGNEADQVTRVIYVVADQTAPVITLNGSADTTIEVGSVWQDPLATAFDNKEGNLTGSLVTSGEVDADLLGVYTITYSISDNQGNASSMERIVRVVDTQNPVIVNAAAAKPAGSCWVVEVQLQNIFADITSATDNYNNLGQGLTLTANPASAQGGAAVDTRFQGTTTVVYTATDESGNVTTQCVDYVVRDYIAPEIELNTLPIVYHTVNTPYTPVQPSVSDNLYNSTQISLTSTSNVEPYTLGEYQDVYTATDAAGNVATKTRTVMVVDNEAPVISGKNGNILKLGVGSNYNAVNALNFRDNYDSPADLLGNLTTTHNNINLEEAGIYSLVVQTEDNSGNVSNEYTLTVDVRHSYEVKSASINDISIDDLLNVAPNPTSGILNINVNLPENEEINLAIFNALGQQVVLVENGAISNNKYTVNLNNQSNGIYYVKMNVKGSIVTKKIILNK